MLSIVNGKYYLLPIQRFRCLAILYILLLVFLNSSCTKKNNVYNLQQTFGNVLINQSPPTLYQTIGDNTLIETSASSYCIIKNDTSAIAIIGNSNVLIENIADKSHDLVITLHRGIVYICSKSKLNNIIVKTYNTIFEGDSYCISFMADGNTMTMWCIDGKGTMRYYLNGKENSKSIVSGNQFIITSNEVEYFGIQLATLQEFKINNNIMLQDLSKNSIEQDFLHQKFIALSNISIIDDIRLMLLQQRKGQLQKVITKSGNVYKGSVLAKGALLEITTMSGIITIPQKTVKYVLPYTPMFDE